MFKLLDEEWVHALFEQVRRLRARLVLVSLVSLVLIATLNPRQSNATVEEQRARLPPPAECVDPIEGVWLSHQYEPRLHQWYIMTLTIHRAAPESEKLTGDIVAHFWDGLQKDEQPPPCTQGRLHAKVKMPATGEYKNGMLNFDGGPWKPEPHPCDPPARRIFYNPDNFKGKLDIQLQEFQSVHNDGGVSINVPTVFRRIKCFDQPAPPRVEVTPPPLEPPKRIKTGCSR